MPSRIVPALLLIAAASPLVAQQPVPIDSGELPDPPAAIGDLIDKAQVQFEAGARSRPDEAPGDRRIVAETRYRIAYNYHSQSSWKLVNRGRRLIVHVRYSRLQWKPMHTIWFLTRPAEETFWSNKLVRHELDHVRISSDPRLAKRFEQLLNEQRVLSRSIDDGQVVDREFVDKLVDQHVAEVFAEISDLIAIRYKELDRVTDHGLHPVPDDSELSRWLQSSTEL